MRPSRSSDLTFRDCALAEATRYGSDPWVFLRELLQNARDAGASRVELTVDESDDAESITCRDDGCGMSAAHAERYLFALYASSKEDDERQVGQYGVGFWAVLRFCPRRIVIRSRPRHGPPWQVELERHLESAAFAPCEMAPGTEIVLERPRSGGGALADEVFAAVYRYGRFAMRYEEARGGPLKRREERPLTITVDGRPVHAEMTLPAPSSAFRRRGFRGVVALGAEPQVELFANGLFVRRAASLDDLLDESARADDGEPALELPASVAPRIVLDSRELEVLLARSDVRQTRHLRRLVHTAERELERLIERQLRAVRPPSLLGVLRARLGALGRRLREASPPLRLMPAVLMGGAAAGAVLGWAVLSGAAALAPAPSGRPIPMEGYADLGARYLGPRLDPLETRVARPDLTYSPADQELFLNALAIADPAAWPEDVRRDPDAVGDYLGGRCGPCVDLRLETASGPMRLPVPTGHRLDPASVRLNGRPHPVSRTTQDEPLLTGARRGDVVEYRTGPASARRDLLDAVPAPLLPASLEAVAQRLRTLPLRARTEGAVAEVRGRVSYDRTAAAALAYQDARDDGLDFVEAALKVRKGDCDVQNGLVVALLQRSDVVARLAVGYVGRDGLVGPGLHAWAEYLDEEGRWRIADATPPVPVTPADPPSVAVAAMPPDFGVVVKVPAAPGVLVVLAAAVVGLGGWLWHRSWGSGSRRLEAREAALVPAETDLAALLGGALRHPGLGRLPALLYGRLIPLVGPGRAISLAQARRRAAAGKLFASSGEGRLAREAAARGRWVIDAGAPEGRVSSLGLGATDLDAWESLLGRRTRPPLAGEANSYLEGAGERWRVAFVTPLDTPAAVVDLARLGLGDRQVLLDPRQAGLAEAALERPSAAAVFRLLDAAAAHLGLVDADRARVLAEPARRALVEGFGP